MAITPFQSRIITDTGISMGDEGKGRLVHEVVREIQEAHGPEAVGMILKVNGGANSGHTAAGLKLNLLPCGVAEPDVPVLGLGAGVVADPRKIWWEMLPLEAENRYEIFSRLLIDERCMVSDLNHRLLDLAGEFYRAEILGQEPRGSTGRGITPGYVDETGQQQIFFQVFRESREAYAGFLRERTDRALRTIKHVYRVTPEAWFQFFETLTEAETRANAETLRRRLFDRDEFDFRRFAIPGEPFRIDFEELLETYWNAGSNLATAIRDLREEARRLLDEEKYLIGEFGQSYWLDKRHGFPPNVTASHTFSPEIFQSAGLPVQPLHNIGVCKAYDTKVGTHVFLTRFEEEHPLGQRLAKLEFGTSTGRQRMVGWFDAVEKGDAIRYGGCQDLMINKMDVLGQGDDWSGPLKICVAYEDPDGQRIYSVPRSDARRRNLRPAFVEMPSWEENLSRCRSWDELPGAAQNYVAAMMKAMADVATRHGKSPLPLPNLRYLGLGPMPKQIVKDIPDTPALLRLASGFWE